jgi:hypothetical protein
VDATPMPPEPELHAANRSGGIVRHAQEPPSPFEGMMAAPVPRVAVFGSRVPMQSALRAITEGAWRSLRVCSENGGPADGRPQNRSRRPTG